MVRQYRIEHRTVYHYPDDVSASFSRGWLRPRDLPGQRCTEFRLIVTPEPSDMADATDIYGNSNTYFHVTDPHAELTVAAVSEVVVEPVDWDAASAGRPWEEAVPAAGSDPRVVEFTLPSPLVQMPDAVRRYAARSFPPGRPLLGAIADLRRRVHEEFRYERGTTSVSSTVTDVLDAGAGVCQDFAHLATACVRAMGVPCRYVSGYLATDPPPGRERMIGADAGHAWAAVRLPDGDWLGFDPTSDQFTGERYTTVAWGRDYDDVPPLRGVIFTDSGRSDMEVSVDVAPL